MRHFLISYFSAVLVCASTSVCFAQGTNPIDCPGDRAYRDNRPDGGGGQVFCEHVLPGSLTVKDGPFRFWFNRDFEGSAGNYNDGREVGKWKECDRFGRCEQKEYPAIYPEEKQRPGFKPEVPVAYVDAKYVFDFASCRSTWVTHTDGQKPDLDLNIGARSDGCFIAHIPADAIGHEGNTDYTCTIPFQVGRRAFGSLDLLTEFPKAGLPQYCAKQVFKTGPYMSSVDPNRGKGPAQVFTAEYSLGNNGVGIAQARLQFQERAESRSDRCVVRYDPGSKSLFLLSDQPGKYLGPIDLWWKGFTLEQSMLSRRVFECRGEQRYAEGAFAILFNPAQLPVSTVCFWRWLTPTNVQVPPRCMGIGMCPLNPPRRRPSGLLIEVAPWRRKSRRWVFTHRLW